MRQLTACIDISLVSTLSAQYTVTAIDHTKAEMISEVSDSDFQAQNVKDAFTTAASSSTSSVSTETSKEMESLAKETPTHFIITDINFQRARY